MSNKHTDLSLVSVSVAPSPATSGTSLGVTDANAAKLPDVYPWWALIKPSGTAPTRANAEIVKVTAGSSSAGTTTYTIVRAQGIPVTTARTVIVGDDILEVHTAQKQIDTENQSAQAHVIAETPSGTINGTTTSFTLANAPLSGTLKLYLNGQRLTYTTDFTLSGTTITMVTAPITNDILRADYSISAGDFAVGSASWSSNETPSGLVNGSNTTYTLAAAPITGTLALYRDGQLLTGGGADYTLTTNSISFTTAPVTGSVLLAFYQSAASSAGNAATLNGIQASSYVQDGYLVPDFGGWCKVNATPTYASASTINTISDLTAYIQKGDRLRFKQGAGYKYAVVVAITSTLITIAVNTDYTVANSAITDFYYSHQENPIGYPDYFNWTPTLTGATATTATVIGQFRIRGSEVKADYKFTLGASSAIGAENYWNVPVVALATSYETGTCLFEDTGTGRSAGTAAFLVATSRLYPISDTATGFRLVTSTVPHTWASTDILTTSITYRF